MKKQIRKMVLIHISTMALLLAFLAPVPIQARTITLNYANFPPAHTFPCVQMERWKVEVEKRTNGMVKVKTFPGSTLLNPKNMMDGVIAGTADIGNLVMAYQPGRFIITNATSLPLGIEDAQTASLVLWDIYKKYQPKSFAKVKVLAMFANTPSNIMSKKPIRNLQELKGVNLRASGVAAQILKTWGANPVGMPMSATPEALQKGTVKGLFSSLEVMKDFKFANLLKNATMTDTGTYAFAVVMNKEKWNSLPKKIQKILDELSLQQVVWTGRYVDNHVKEAVEWSKSKKNVSFHKLSPSQKAQWAKMVEPIVAKWIKDTTAKGYPAKAIVEDIKKFRDMYSGQ